MDGENKKERKGTLHVERFIDEVGEVYLVNPTKKLSPFFYSERDLFRFR